MTTNLKHVAELSVTMRQEDKDEIWHLARVTPEMALREAWESCPYNRTVLLDGKVVAIFGCSGVKGGVGNPWMLASPLLTKIRKSFLRECRAFLQEMSEGYSSLYNMAWSKNEEHLLWLRWLGFSLEDPFTAGPDGEVFIPFRKIL